MTFLIWSDLFLIILNIIGMLIAFIALWCTKNKNTKDLMPFQKEAADYYISWLRFSIVWTDVRQWLNANAIMTTMLIPFLSNTENIVRVYIYSAWSLFATILPLIINMKKYSIAFRKAANYMYEYINGTEEEIVKAKKECEQYIAEAYDE